MASDNRRRYRFSPWDAIGCRYWLDSTIRGEVGPEVFADIFCDGSPPSRSFLQVDRFLTLWSSKIASAAMSTILSLSPAKLWVSHCSRKRFLNLLNLRGAQ